MSVFLATIAIVFLSVFVGSAIAWAIAGTLLHALEQGVGRPAAPVEIPITPAVNR